LRKTQPKYNKESHREELSKMKPPAILATSQAKSLLQSIIEGHSKEYFIFVKIGVHLEGSRLKL